MRTFISPSAPSSPMAHQTRRSFPILPLFAALLSVNMALPSQAQTAYVSSEKDHTLTVIDLKTQAVTGTVATCKRPRHVQVTPDGKKLLVACAESNAADVIDLATRKSVGRLAIGEDPEAFDLSPDGKTLYISQEDDAALERLTKPNTRRVRSERC